MAIKHKRSAHKKSEWYLQDDGTTFQVTKDKADVEVARSNTADDPP
jgi:hypothetical protein